MRKYELELIAGLAEGNLEDESVALALVESSPEHRAEYEAQKAAIETMRSVPTAHLTETERAVLHRDVWAQLTSQPTSTVRAAWYYRWVFGGAAILVIGVGLVTVLSQAADEGATAAFEEVASDLGEGAGDAAATLSGSSDEAQPVDTTEASAAAEDLPDPLTAYFSDRADVARLEGAEGVAAPDAEPQALAEKGASCLEQAGLEDHVAIAEITVDDAIRAGLDTDKTYLIAIPSGEDLTESTPVAFIETDTCIVVHLDE